MPSGRPPVVRLMLSDANMGSVLGVEEHGRRPLTDDDDLCIGGFRYLELGLDAFVLQLFVGEAFADDMLVVGDALRLYPFTLGLLLFFLQNILHLLGVLFRAHLLFDARLYGLGQADVTDQQLFKYQAAFLKFAGDGFIDPALEFISFDRIQRDGVIIDGVVADTRAGQRPDDLVGIIETRLPDDTRGIGGQHPVEDG